MVAKFDNRCKVANVAKVASVAKVAKMTHTSPVIPSGLTLYLFSNTLDPRTPSQPHPNPLVLGEQQSIYKSIFLKNLSKTKQN